MSFRKKRRKDPTDLILKENKLSQKKIQLKEQVIWNKEVLVTQHGLQALHPSTGSPQKLRTTESC